MKFLAGRPFQPPLHPRFVLIMSTAALPSHHHHLQKHQHCNALHWIAVKLTIYLIFHVFRRPIWQISKCTLQVIYFIYVNFCLRESQCISSQMVWLCSGLESCYFVFSPAAVAFWCQPWRANIFILFLVLYVTAPACWDNIFTFCAFLAFCWGRGEIPGGGGVCSRVLRGGGEWEGGRRGGGGELGNCPEIAHCHCPPPTNCPFSASRFDWKENSGLWSSIRKYSRSYRVSWHAEAANYELNQAWNAPISCFRPCLMVKINYCHASEVIIIVSRQANSGVPIKDAFAKEFRQKCLFSVTVRLTIRVDALRWGFRDFLGVHSTQQYG